MTDKKTISIYDSKSCEYASLTKVSRPSKQLNEFMNEINHGGTVLDLGCGPGIASAFMKKNGFKNVYHLKGGILKYFESMPLLDVDIRKANNVLLCLSQVTKLFYPNSTTDDFCSNLQSIQKSVIKNKNLKIGRNVLVGKNVSIGKNTSVGHNTIIEKNVSIGDNCTIGSNSIIRNTFIGNNVKILDNCVIGKHGFGFFPDKKTNVRYPHIGIVIIEDYCEIGCGSTIDRGSMSNTIIGKNTFLDNQIHVAHNVKVGENGIIAGQVGIAGSSVIGKNVKIGGQAGISGHLKIGDNVEIAGGSGVIKDIPENSKVMGDPAKNIRQFLKDNK